MGIRTKDGGADARGGTRPPARCAPAAAQRHRALALLVPPALLGRVHAGGSQPRGGMRRAGSGTRLAAFGVRSTPDVPGHGDPPRPPSLLAALSMARQSPSRLERRIMAILRPRRPRPSALFSGALLAVTGLLGLSTAIAHPVPREQTDASVTRADQTSIPGDRRGEPGRYRRCGGRGKPRFRPPVPQAVGTADGAGRGAAEVGIEDAGNAEPGPDFGDGASLTGAVDRGRSALSDSPGTVTAGYDLTAPRPVDLQEVSCYPPSTDREDTGDPVPGRHPVFNVRTLPIIGVERRGADRFAVTVRRRGAPLHARARRSGSWVQWAPNHRRGRLDHPRIRRSEVSID